MQLYPLDSLRPKETQNKTKNNQTNKQKAPKTPHPHPEPVQMICQCVQHIKGKVEIILELHKGLGLLFSKKHPCELCM